MSETKSIVVSGRIYAISSVVNRTAGVLLVPLFTHVLSPAEFGQFMLLQSIVDVLSILCGMGLTGAMNRFYLEHADDEKARDRVVSTVLLLVVGLAVVTALVAWLAAPWVARVLLDDSVGARQVALALLGLGLIALFEVECAYAVVRKRAWLYFGLSCAKAIGLLGANLVCVVWLRMGVAGALLATAIAMGLVALPTLVLLLRRCGMHLDPALARQLIVFGTPLVPSAVGASALGLVERYYLNSAAGAAAVGLYSLASRISSLLQMFLAAPFSQTYSVRRVETLVRGEGQAVFDRILLLFVLVMALAAFALTVFGNDLLAVIAPGSYAQAVALVPVLGLCATLAAINFNLELGLHYTKRTWGLPLITAVTLAASIPLNAWLAAKWGAMGTALALLAVNVVRILATLVVNARYGSRLVRLDWPRALVILGVSGGAGVLWVTFGTPALDPWWMLAKACLVAMLALALLPALGREGRADLASAWQQRAPRAGVA